MAIDRIAFLAILSVIGFCDAQWTPDPFCPYPSDISTRYPYYGNCSVYWECFEGTKYVMECPTGLEFNAQYQRCDDPTIANCDPYASTTSNPNPPTYTTNSGPTEGPGLNCPTNSENLTYFPYPGDCTKYWECYEGNSYLYTCPAGLWWHNEIEECDYPGDFCDNNATNPTQPTKPTEPTTSKPVHTTDDSPTTPGTEPNCTQGGTTYWPQPGDCTKYVECIDGIGYVRDCPPGTFFEDVIKSCSTTSSCCSVYDC